MGVLTGKNPTDRGKKAPNGTCWSDGKGTPLAVRITAANRNESLEAMNLVDDIPPIRSRRGRPRRKPKALYGDRAYGTKRNREGLKQRRIEDHLCGHGRRMGAAWARSAGWWNGPWHGSGKPAA